MTTLRNKGRTAIAVACMPGQRCGARFAPTTELILSSLDGLSRPHPVYNLALHLEQGAYSNGLDERGVDAVTVIFDDLCAERTWPRSLVGPQVGEVWPTVAQRVNSLFDRVRFPVTPILFSQYLEKSRDRQVFEAHFGAAVDEFNRAISEGRPRQLVDAVRGELLKRRRFANIHATGQSQAELADLAVRHVANYVAQGRLFFNDNDVIYLPWMAEETHLMALPGPKSLSVIDTYYDTAPIGREQSGRAMLRRFPDEYEGLAVTLEMYLDDVPTTPGTIGQDMIAHLLDCLAALLNEGTTSIGRRDLTALNEVLPGGPQNKTRTTRLINTFQSDLPLPQREQYAKKIFCQLSSRYTDAENLTEARRHHRVVSTLASHLSHLDGLALGLTGSLPEAHYGIWHPYWSDIDIAPLHATTPNASHIATIEAAYDQVERPEWAYVNFGARQGLFGVQRPPMEELFVTNHIPTLTPDELCLLNELTTGMHWVGGDKAIYDDFHRTVAAHRHAHAINGGGQ